MVSLEGFNISLQRPCFGLVLFLLPSRVANCKAPEAIKDSQIIDGEADPAFVMKKKSICSLVNLMEVLIADQMSGESPAFGVFVLVLFGHMEQKRSMI